MVDAIVQQEVAVLSCGLDRLKIGFLVLRKKVLFVNFSFGCHFDLYFPGKILSYLFSGRGIKI